MREIIQFKKLLFCVFFSFLGLFFCDNTCHAKMAEYYFSKFYIDDYKDGTDVTGKANYVDDKTLKFRFFSKDSNGFISNNCTSAGCDKANIVVHISKLDSEKVILSKIAEVKTSDQCHYFDLELTPSDISPEQGIGSDDYFYKFCFYLCPSSLNEQSVTEQDLIGSYKSFIAPWDDIRDDFAKKINFTKADGSSYKNFQFNFVVLPTGLEKSGKAKINFIDLFLENEPVYKGVDCSDFFPASGLRNFDKLKLKVFKSDGTNLEQAEPLVTLDEVALIKAIEYNDIENKDDIIDTVGSDVFRFDFSGFYNQNEGSDNKIDFEIGKEYVFKLYDLNENYLGCFNYVLTID